MSNCSVLECKERNNLKDPIIVISMVNGKKMQVKIRLPHCKLHRIKEKEDTNTGKPIPYCQWLLSKDPMRIEKEVGEVNWSLTTIRWL